MNELATLTGLTASDLFLNKVTPEMRFEAVKVEALKDVFDVTTAKGRAECIAHAAKVGKDKTAIEKLGKALVDPMKAETKVIDVERKFYKDNFGELQAEIRLPVTLLEEEEARAKAAIDQHFFELEQAGVTTSPVTGELHSEVKLQNNLKHINGLDPSVFGDRYSDAELLISAGKTRIAAALKQREEADELDALRKEAAERKAKEESEANEKRIIEEHEAKKAAEVKEAPEKRTASEVRAIVETLKAPKTKLAINQALVVAFREVAGIEAGQAKVILTAIAKSQIPNISINYEN